MPNRLANATSPYLLQHADNPVDWYEWGPEALQRAKDEDKAILLSIGYSACHWCHVMAHESFEDPAIAASMNERFINIKVDREERPDLDHIYMSAVQAMTRSGGWPLTVFLTPDLEPFYGGTYFPPEPRHGIPSFPQTLEAVHQHWTERREDCLQHGRGLKEWIEATTTLRASAGEPTPQLLDDAVKEMVDRFDPEWGGFGPAPKFPQPMNLSFLLRRHVKGDARAAVPIRSTLTRMARGGIFDQLGGGFCRYSTDRVWLVPHFEKMLYDNAQLLSLYTRAWQVFADPLYARTVRMTVDFLLRELRLPDGGFASSLDADSPNAVGEMEEGAFYVFGYDELIAAAGDDMPLAISAFALAGPGNWEGKTVLWRPVEDDELCERHGISAEVLEETVERVRAAWFAVRETRPRPGRDDKVLAGWNGLTIGALAEAGRVFDEPSWIDAAIAAASFCATTLRRDDGRLLRAWRDGRTSGPGFLDDHAMLADGFLTLYETTGDVRWFTEARTLIDQMRARFSDARGGFHDTGDDAEGLLVRPKDLFDNAVPSGNAVAAQVLLRFSALEADPEPETLAAGYLSMMAPAFEHSPGGFGSGLEALDRYLSPRSELAIVGDPADPRTKELAAVADLGWFPDLVRAIGEHSEHAPGLLDHPKPDQPVAYLCERFACQMPTSDPSVLSGQLARS